MTIFPTSVEDLTHWSNIFNALYMSALVVGILSTAGALICSNRLQTIATLKLAETEQKNIKLGIELEKERQARLELARKSAPRVLTGKQTEALIESLRPYQNHFISVTKVGVEEAGDYADSIYSALKQANWRVERRYRAPYEPPPTPRGVICRSSAHPDGAIKALKATFEKIGIPLTWEEVKAQSNEYVEIVVGVKPFE